MANLTNFNDIFSSLAESAYSGNRPNPFPIEDLNKKQKENLNKGKSVEFEFSQEATVSYKVDGKWVTETTKGGTNLPNGGKVYLQPDSSGILTDEKAGYNSYFVTDQSTVKDSKETYFVTRGSDGMSVENLNDWVNNNANFTLFNAYIPQAKLAEKAMEVVCEETVIYY
jgi:hypothetical protein